MPKQLLFFYQRLTPLDDTSNRNYSDVRWKKSSAAPAPPSLVANWNNFPSRLDRCNRLIVGYSFAHFCRPRQKYDTNIPTPFPLPTSNTTTTSYKEKEYLITFRVGTFSLNSSTTFFSWPPWHLRGSPFWWQCKPSPSSKHAEWQTWTVALSTAQLSWKTLYSDGLQTDTKKLKKCEINILRFYSNQIFYFTTCSLWCWVQTRNLSRQAVV